jgi:hypothetical protein
MKSESGNIERVRSTQPRRWVARPNDRSSVMCSFGRCLAGCWATFLPEE